MLSLLIEKSFFVIGDLLITGITNTQIISKHALNLYYTHIYSIPIIQLFLTKISPFFLNTPVKKTEIKSCYHYPIEYIKNNQVIHNSTVEKVFKTNVVNSKENSLNQQYDFLICSRPCDTHKTIFKKIIYPEDISEIYKYSHENLKQFLDMNKNNSPGEQFISCCVGDETFKLNDNSYNFYITGNTFNSTFFDYLFKTYYTNINYNKNNTEMHLIDNSADMITISPNLIVSITKDSFEIKKK
jgi:hypothetical protein